MLAAAFVFFTSPAKAQSCDQLAAIDCATSTDCMYQKIGEADQYACVAPTNRCQIGFSQGGANDSAKASDICQSRPGCSYVPAGECYCPPNVDCICGGGTPPDCAADTNANLAPPVGRYVIVAIRSASDVAAPLGTAPRTDIITQAFTFTVDGVSTDGLGCDQWAVERVNSGISFNDSILADTLIGPMDSAISVGDKRILDHWRYTCEGEHFLTLTQIDRRVLVILWNNSAQYLIAEKPLSQAEVTRLQEELKTMKFYNGVITGKIDEATVSSLGFWAGYRARPTQTFRFARTAITENLLDALRVLTSN